MNVGAGNGQDESRNGQPSSHPRPCCAMDWGFGKKLTHTHDGVFAEEYVGRLRDAIMEHAGWEIALESTFESYDPDERNYCILLAEQHNVLLRAYSPRSTRARRREAAKAQGVSEDSLKSDLLDALWIWQTAYERPTEPKRPTRYAEPTPEELYETWKYRRRQVNMRRSGYTNEDAVRLRAMLAGRLESVRFDMYRALFDGRKRKDGLVLSVALAADYAVTHEATPRGQRDLFDRLVGLYGHGYPGIIRSNFFNHRVPALMRDGFSRKEAMRRCRLATRRILHEVQRAHADGQGESRNGQPSSHPAAFVGPGDQAAFDWSA